MTKKKIQLPWVKEDIRREKKRDEKLMQYWELAQAWNARKAITIQDAINLSKDILGGLDPNSAIAVRSQNIQNNIVMHATKTAYKKFQRTIPEYKEPEPAKIIIM